MSGKITIFTVLMDANEIKTDILLLRSGDTEAYRRLYDHYWAKVLHFAALYLKDGYEQEETVQQVFIRLWEMRGRLDPELGLDGLLFILTRNFIFNRAHRSLNEEAVKEALRREAEVTDDGTFPEAEDLRRYVDRLVSALPPRQREAFLLSREEGLTYAEIATRMRISEKGVERNIHLALKFLKTHLPLFLFFVAG
ncbi:MAG: RNA polymerase sigma-70 factor [Bacteroidales bacterium]|nr:RNA polymerase sigma-70 factor [Bacteroidales bacterium]